MENHSLNKVGGLLAVSVSADEITAVPFRNRRG